MKRLRLILIGLVVVVLGVYGCSSLMHPTVTINYRLTLEAMTPDGPKTGSGVIQVSYGSEFNLNGGGRKGVIQVTGEAVPVDLGQGKILFVTLTKGASGRNSSPGTLDGSLDAGWLPVYVFGFDWNWGEEHKLISQITRARVAGPIEVALHSLPDLVTFEDIADPRTVKLVQPEALTSKFGAGYALIKASIEVTDAPPTEQIEGELRWLNSLEKYLTDPTNPFTSTARVARRQFIQGD